MKLPNFTGAFKLAKTLNSNKIILKFAGLPLRGLLGRDLLGRRRSGCVRHPANGLQLRPPHQEIHAARDVLLQGWL